MTAGVYNGTIDQGATWTTLLTLQNSDATPINLTGYSARMQLRLSAESADELLELTSPSAGITFPDASAGQIRIVISAAQSAALPPNIGLAYDLEIESAGGVVTRVIQGTLFVSAEVTR